MIYKNRKPIPIEEKAKKTSGKLFLVKDIDPTILQVIKYEYPKNRITVELTSEEFTCVCPFSGLPDFALLTIKYIPRQKLIELKSLKYYLYSFRNVRVYNEHVINKILEDLKKVLIPYEIIITGEWTSRGGIRNRVIARYCSKK
ncbi:MAG: preQ(1) synthase [Candidatus Omnitrophota bacterium]